MPSEVLMARYEGHHGLHPVRVLDACSSTLEGLLDVVEPVAALQGVASMANGARDVEQRVRLRLRDQPGIPLGPQEALALLNVSGT